MENVTKHGDIKVVITERRRHYLVRTNFYTTKFLTDKLLAIEIHKTEILMDKTVDLGLSIL